MPKALFLRNNLDEELLHSSTTYRTEQFDRCIYCHKQAENDYFEYRGELVGMPYRCTCKKAQAELDAKEQLLKQMLQLQSDINVDKINTTTKLALIAEIEDAFQDNSENRLNQFARFFR